MSDKTDILWADSTVNPVMGCGGCELFPFPDWDEWPGEALKVRKFPKAFHNYRKNEMKPQKKSPRKTSRNSADPDLPVSEADKNEFDRLDGVVRKGVESYMEAGAALFEIHQRKLWRAGGYATWKEYCESVVGKSTAQVQRLMEASRHVSELVGLPDATILPQNESQARPLSRLKDPEDRRAVWQAVGYWVEDQGPDYKLTAEIITEMVDWLLEEMGQEQRKRLASRKQRRDEVLKKLRVVIEEQSSWELAKKLLDELDKLV